MDKRMLRMKTTVVFVVIWTFLELKSRLEKLGGRHFYSYYKNQQY